MTISVIDIPLITALAYCTLECILFFLEVLWQQNFNLIIVIVLILKLRGAVITFGIHAIAT